MRKRTQKKFISVDYRPIHIATFLLMLFSAFTIMSEVGLFTFSIFLVWITVSFGYTWEDRDLGAARYAVLEYAFWPSLFLLLALMLLNTSFRWEEVLMVGIKAMLILEVFMGFYLARRRRYAFLQIMSLLLFLISTILVIRKTKLYFLCIFLYAAVWFLILRLSFLRDVRGRASQLVYDRGRKRRYVELAGIASFFLIIFLVTALIAGGIKRPRPYEIGFFPSQIFNVFGEYEDSDIVVDDESLHGLEDINFQRFNELMKTIEGLESIAAEDKAPLMRPLSKLVDKDTPIQEVLEALLGLISFLKEKGPGFERGEGREEIVYTLQALDSYAESRLLYISHLLNGKVSSEIKGMALPKTEMDRLNSILVRLRRARTIDAVNRSMAELKKLEPAGEDALISKLTQIGLAKVGGIYIKEKGSLENIAAIVKNLENITDRTVRSKNYYKIFNFEYEMDRVTKKSRLSEREKKQIADLKKELYSAKSVNDLKESLESISSFVERLRASEKLSRADYEVLSYSIKGLGDLPGEIMGSEKKGEGLKGGLGRVVSIEIIPERQQVPLGEEAIFRAMGLYPPFTKKDISGLCDWVSSRPDVATTISGGRLTTLSEETTFITASLGDVRSNKAILEVIQPSLVSIEILNLSTEIAIGKSAKLRAEGSYSDSHIEDITEKTIWLVDNKEICDISITGEIMALGMGEAKISAEYQGVSSPTYTLMVVPLVIRSQWLLLLLVSIVLTITLLASVILIYILNKDSIKQKEAAAKNNPRHYIITLYRCLTKIFAIYGVKCESSTSPEAYLRLVHEKMNKAIEEPLSVFTKRFCLARYASCHIDPQYSLAMKKDYNRLLREVRRTRSFWQNLYVGLRASIQLIPCSL